MLNDLIVDFDLASYADACKRKNVFRLGTVPFMSREALDGFSEKYEHGLPHDLESVYYVFATLAAGYRKSTPKAKGDPLRLWRKGKFAKMRDAKNEHMQLVGLPFNVNYKGKMAIPIEDPTTASRLENIRVEYRERAFAIGAITANQMEEEKKITRALAQQAMREGKTDAEVLLLMEDKRREFAEARPSQRATNTISFKMWLEGAMLPIDEEHLKCDCCEKD